MMLVSNEPTILIFDFQAITLAQLGLITAFHMPGNGVILHAAGQLLLAPTGAPPDARRRTLGLLAHLLAE